MAAMLAVQRLARRSGESAWHWLALAMLPALVSAMCACTWHLYDNSAALRGLVVLQAALTALGNGALALAALQLGESGDAERELRALIRRYPLFADARAALTALLWQKGAFGEAESHWAAASGLDPRYRQPAWLAAVRRWPPAPVAALERFLALGTAAA